MQRRTRARREGGGEHGSALAEFVLVCAVLVPLVLAILQVVLVWHVRSTLTAAASEGARHGAAYLNTPADARQRTATIIDETFGPGLAARVSASGATVDGQPAVVVHIEAAVPVLAFWGPRVGLSVDGHAVKEVLP